MSTLANIIAQATANTKVTPEASFSFEKSIIRREGSAEYEIQGTPPGLIVGSPEDLAINSRFIPSVDESGDDVTLAILNERDPENTSQFKYPRYFAQTGGNRGFTYFYTDAKGNNSKIIFETGVFVSTDVALCTQLIADIRRPIGGIGAKIKNITEATYEDMARSAKMYNAAAAGIANTSNQDAHRLAREQRLQAMQQTIDEQTRVIASLQTEARTQLAQNQAAAS